MLCVLVFSPVCEYTDSPKGDRKVVDCANSVLKDHSYWPLVSDLINLFSHRDVALYFMSDTLLLTHWANIMACFQGLFSSFLLLCSFRSIVRHRTMCLLHMRMVCAFVFFYFIFSSD